MYLLLPLPGEEWLTLVIFSNYPPTDKFCLKIFVHLASNGVCQKLH